VLKIPGSTYSVPLFLLFFYHGTTAPSGPRPPHYRRLIITLRYTTLGRSPQDERSARRRVLYLTTHNTHNRQTSMPPAGLEPTFPASMRPQTHALDRAATGIGTITLKTANEWTGRILNKLLPSGIRRWWSGKQLPTFRKDLSATSAKYGDCEVSCSRFLRKASRYVPNYTESSARTRLSPASKQWWPQICG